MFRYFDVQFNIPKLRVKDRNCPNDARRYKLCSILMRVRTGRGKPVIKVKVAGSQMGGKRESRTEKRESKIGKLTSKIKI